MPPQLLLTFLPGGTAVRTMGFDIALVSRGTIPKTGPRCA